VRPGLSAARAEAGRKYERKRHKHFGRRAG
jgi:hypothetical protein